MMHSSLYQRIGKYINIRCLNDFLCSGYVYIRTVFLFACTHLNTVQFLRTHRLNSFLFSEPVFHDINNLPDLIILYDIRKHGIHNIEKWS